jgi:predicted phosphodiesterase
MRYLIVADIHANLTAFEAIITDARRNGDFSIIWCLGDIVGYGPDPHECIDLLRKFEHVCIAGNHDHAAVGMIETSGFNPSAAVANRWTTNQLSAEDTRFLSRLPFFSRQGDITLVHGSPREPLWEYVITDQSAEISLDSITTLHCMVGHSHLPLMFIKKTDKPSVSQRVLHGSCLQLKEGRILLNPGGAGQPRDNDPRASYAILDDARQAITFYRVVYNVKATQNKMLNAGLPMSLVTRLSTGW